MTEFPEIKQLTDGSSRILLVCDKDRSDFDYLAAASSLLYTLKKIGKIVNCYPQQITSKFPIPLVDNKEMKNFVLTINNHTGSISDIYYQKGPKELKLYFTFANGGYIIRIRPMAIGMFVVPTFILFQNPLIPGMK